MSLPRRLRRRPRRVVFAEGEEEQVIRAAASFVHQGLGTALLVGREPRVRATAQALGIEPRHLDLLIDSIIGGRGVDRHPRQRQIHETVMLYRDPHRGLQAHHLRTDGGIGDLTRQRSWTLSSVYIPPNFYPQYILTANKY